MSDDDLWIQIDDGNLIRNSILASFNRSFIMMIKDSKISRGPLSAHQSAQRSPLK
jgi:hypothetical protein